MAKMTLSNEMASLLIRYRAICEDDTFKGPWRTSIDEETHIIRILQEQTVSMRFKE